MEIAATGRLRNMELGAQSYWVMDRQGYGRAGVRKCRGTKCPAQNYLGGLAEALRQDSTSQRNYHVIQPL